MANPDELTNEDVAGESDVEITLPEKFQKGMFSPTKRGRPRTPEDVKRVFREMSPWAIKALFDIVSDEDSKKPERIKAAEVILDRAWGKAPQTVTDTNGNTLQGVLVLPAIELPSIEKVR